MCDACALRGEVLPSLESFQMRWHLPKVHFLFYEYLFRPAVGDTTWRRRIIENRRLGTKIVESYAMATLRNHYFAWLYEYKTDNLHANLKTEYDPQEAQQGTNAAAEGSQDNRQEQEVKLFCGELDFVEVSVPTHPVSERSAAAAANDNSSDDEEDDPQVEPTDQFEILSGRGETAEAHKAAREHDQAILKNIQEEIAANRENGSAGSVGATTSKTASYSKMSKNLADDAAKPAAMNLSERRKRKHKSMMGLRDFTTTARKSRKGSKELQGWTKAGQRYVMDVLGEIDQEERSDIRRKWEVVYLKLRKAAEQDNGVDDDDDEEEFVMNHALMYAEV